MRSLRLFYSDDECTCGHLVIASRESQYKILHFHRGGLDKLSEVFEEWTFLAVPKSKVRNHTPSFVLCWTLTTKSYLQYAICLNYYDVALVAGKVFESTENLWFAVIFCCLHFFSVCIFVAHYIILHVSIFLWGLFVLCACFFLWFDFS